MAFASTRRAALGAASGTEEAVVRLLLMGSTMSLVYVFRRALRPVLLAATVAALAAPVAGAAPEARQNAAADTGPPLEGAFAEDFTLLDPPVPAPPDAVTDLAGRPVRLADFAGRVVLVNFWATWCAPCIREMPALDRLQAALGDAGLTVAAVSIDRGGRDAVTAFASELGLKHLALYLDPTSTLARAFGLSGLPTSFLIDVAGRVVGGLQGEAEWDSPEAQALIRYYLETRPAAGTDAAQGAGGSRKDG
jgi:thiol-disulfide isomerase/thioredoxin